MEARVVGITGASSGIGAVLAQRLVQLGARPVLVARREPQLLKLASACGANALSIRNVSSMLGRIPFANAAQRTAGRGSGGSDRLGDPPAAGERLYAPRTQGTGGRLLLR